MRRTAGLGRQTEAGHKRSCAKMLFMATERPLQFPSYWRLQAMGWTSLYVLVLVACIPDMTRPGTLRDQTVAIVFMFLGSLVLRPICRSLLRRSLPWLALELKASVWSLVLGTIGAFTAELTVLRFRTVDWKDLAGNSVQFSVVLFLWCSLYFSIKQWQQSTQERERLLRAETEAREARLSALRYQLNPHFLFNSLNAVSTLVLDGNAPAATRMLAQIGELLRTSLDNEVMPEVTLSQEMVFTQRYLAIEQTRLGERLQVDLAIPSETLDALVPSMLLQPLVENAVRHGVVPLVRGGRITIASALRVDRLQIVIGNSGTRGGETQNENGNGIGLRNTAERLETLYGDDHRFTLQWPEAGGCQVIIELPLRRIAQNVEEATCAH
jgi:two-component system, LytTR family, sensor kinase